MRMSEPRGIGTQASVVSRPAVGVKEKRANRWMIEAFGPVPLTRLIEAVGQEAASLVKTVERDGGLFVPLREIANKLGRGLARALRNEPMWVAEIPHNNVVHEGLDHSLNVHFKGSSYTAAWYIGLTDGTPTVADTDTIASHAGWTEVTGYSETYRQTLTLGAVSSQSVDNSASKGTFSISTATVTVGGAFLISGDGGTAKGGSTNGTMYGGGAFTNGDRSLSNGDTLNVQLSLAAGTA